MKNNQLFLLRSAQNNDIVIAAKRTFQDINEFLFLNSDKCDYYTLNINKNDYTFTTYKEFYELFKNKTHFDILENEKIITYREKEHDLLMDIRNGKYLDENKQPIPEFFEMVNELEKRLEYDAENTSLPDSPDYKRINEFVMSVNERIVKGEI